MGKVPYCLLGNNKALNVLHSGALLRVVGQIRVNDKSSHSGTPMERVMGVLGHIHLFAS